MSVSRVTDEGGVREDSPQGQRTELGSRPELHFGPYRVLSRLASGGMADVWLAEYESARVVLKTMRPELAESRELATMLLEEGLAARKLHHKNVVKVVDVGEIDNKTYIAMEFVHGRTLRQIAQQYHDRQRRIAPWLLLRILLDACAGLEYVHAYHEEDGWPIGLVHGDVSPENIMVSFTGTVKLVDFGLARAARSANERRGKVIVGKPWYMAPEHIRTGTFDPRADLYALGVILYEFLTGYRPYTGCSETEVLTSVLDGRPAPMRELASDLSDAICATTSRAMARRAEARFQTAADLATELRARLVEIDPEALEWPLEAIMRRLFGEPEEISSSVRVAPREEDARTPDSVLPTMPSDPSVIAAAIARMRRSVPDAGEATVRPPPPEQPAPVIQELRQPPPVPATMRSGSVPMYRGPDIFAQHPKRDNAPVFGRTEAGDSTSGPIGTRLRTEQQLEAARLFEEGLALIAVKDLIHAREAWRKAVDLDPDERRYQSNLRRLEERLATGK